jgi:hypothetical protein
MTKQEENLYFRIGILIGAYFIIIKPILEKVGLSKSAQDLAFEAEDTKAQVSPVSAFSPTFYKTVKNAPLIKRAVAEALAKIVRDSVGGSLLGDDLNKLYSVFRKLQYKTQVSWLSKVYSDMYKQDMITDIKNGSNAYYLTNYRAGLSDAELNKLYEIVKNLK